MKRIAVLLMLLSGGCSTRPLADVLDWVKPGRLSAGAANTYGGVAAPVAPPPFFPDAAPPSGPASVMPPLAAPLPPGPR
jgi:hypothetical protein